MLQVQNNDNLMSHHMFCQSTNHVSKSSKTFT